MKANEIMNTNDTHPPPILSSDRLSHAYITSGSTADTIAMAAVCSGDGERPCMKCVHCSKSSRGIHPDIAVIEKPSDRKDIVIEQIRDLKRDVIVVPNEADRKVYLINNAELMNVSAQNALLQILEEPPSYAVFILRTETPADLLKTVRSRCVELRARADSKAPEETAAATAETFISAIREGNASLVAFMFSLERLDREQFAGFLAAAREQLISELRKTMRNRVSVTLPAYARAERALARAGEFLDLNVNIGHIAGMICANLINMEESF